MEDNFLSSLRAATAGSHQRLEDITLSKALVSKNLTRDGYITYLERLYSIFIYLEPIVFPSTQKIVHDIEQRHRLPLLEKDLSALGRTPGTGQLQENGFPTAPNASPAFAMGILYVMEGSTLGGRVILKNVADVLGYDEHSGAAYFTGYGEQTGPLWKSFVQDLLQFETGTGTGNDIIKGANFAFDLFYSVLSQPAVQQQR